MSPEDLFYKAWAEHLLEAHEIDQKRVAEALALGAYDFDAEDAYCLAAKRGALQVIAALGPRLDWSKYTVKNRPVMAGLNSSKWSTDPSGMAQVCLMLMEHTVQGGRQDLMVDPHTRDHMIGVYSETPLLRCVEINFPAGILFCLEQGADPLFKGFGDHNAMETGDGLWQPELAALIRSFQSKQAALAAIAAIEGMNEPGSRSTPAGARPFP